MNRILKISSEKEIDVRSFTLLGNSTKRNDDTKIGRFGSGLKYAIATLLDKGTHFHVYSGKEEIEFKTERETFRETELDRIFINGELTSFSTQMGPDWGIYDAIREIYSNAVDEGLIDFCILNTEDKESIESSHPKDGETTFYIIVDEAVATVVDNLPKYFSHFRTDAFYKNEKLTIYPSDGRLRIYKSGFLVYKDDGIQSLFHYDFPAALINESRALESLDSTYGNIARVMQKNPTRELVDKIKRATHKDNYDPSIFELNHAYWNYEGADPLWGEIYEGSLIVASSSKDFYSEYIKLEAQAHIMPDKLAIKIKRTNPEKIRMYGGDSEDRANNYIPMKESDTVKSTKIELALNYLKDLGKEIEYDIVIANFQNEHIAGSVDPVEKKIIISSKHLAEATYYDIARTIYEEYAHLESGYPDNSREFQNWLIERVFTYMTIAANEKKRRIGE